MPVSWNLRKEEEKIYLYKLGRRAYHQDGTAHGPVTEIGLGDNKDEVNVSVPIQNKIIFNI